MADASEMSDRMETVAVAEYKRLRAMNKVLLRYQGTVMALLDLEHALALGLPRDKYDVALVVLKRAQRDLFQLEPFVGAF